MTQTSKLWRNARIATFCGSEHWGWIEHGAIVTQGDAVMWVGEKKNLPAEYASSIDEECDVGGACVTPGLCKKNLNCEVGNY